MVFLNWSSTNQHSSRTSRFCIIWKSTECTFCPLIWAVEDTEQYLQSSPLVTVLISSHQLDIKTLTLLLELGGLTDFQPTYNPFLQPILCHIINDDAFENKCQSLTKVKIYCIRSSPFICVASRFIIADNQIGQACFALGKSLLTFLNYCLVLYMLEIDSRRTCSTILPRTKVKPTIV